MSARHVLGHGGRSAVVASRVGRHAPALEEDLEGCGGVADLDLLSDQLVGHAVGLAMLLAEAHGPFSIADEKEPHPNTPA